MSCHAQALSNTACIRMSYVAQSRVHRLAAMRNARRRPAAHLSSARHHAATSSRPVSTHFTMFRSALMLRVARAVFTLIGCCCVVGCGQHRGDAAVVAEAGNVTLSAHEVRRLVAGLPAETRAALSADRSALERVMRAELVRRSILEEAHASGLDGDAETASQIDRARDDALVRLWIAKQGRVPDGYP